MKNKENEALDALKEMENKAKGISDDKKISNSENKEEQREFLGDYKLPSTIDGWRTLEKSQMPFLGKLYPESWEFAYRCPTSMEVANFSTLNEEDMPAIQQATSDLIKKCFVIVDSEKQNQISTEEINEGEKLFFFLKLREFYLHDLPIQYGVVNQRYNEPIIIDLISDLLIYPKLTDKLLSYFDGRKFSIPVSAEKNIEFLIPTFKTTSRVFNYMIKTYKELQSDENNKKNVENFDKQFLLFASFLYETGSETIESLKLKFKKIQKDEELYRAYLNLINSIKLSNLEKIVYSYKESEEEALIKFPGGWKNMFINGQQFEGLFE